MTSARYRTMRAHPLPRSSTCFARLGGNANLAKVPNHQQSTPRWFRAAVESSTVIGSNTHRCVKTFSRAAAMAWKSRSSKTAERGTTLRAPEPSSEGRPRGSRTMCRWIFYYGEEVCIAKLIFGATHGLATMSEVGASHAQPPAAATVARDLTGKDRPRPKRELWSGSSTSPAGLPRSSSFPATGHPARRLARPRLTSLPTRHPSTSLPRAQRPLRGFRVVRRAPDTPPGAR